MHVNDYLENVKDRFEYYKDLGERAIDQLDEAQLFWRPHEEVNSVAIIVNHLYGNMRSRWTDFLTADGEKDWRYRDMEFEEVIKTGNELKEKWEAGWSCLFEALDQIDESTFERKITIRGEEHSILQAINRQLTHYTYHIGQIVWLAHMIKADQWKSLSIPKGKSEAFNEQMRQREK